MDGTQFVVMHGVPDTAFTTLDGETYRTNGDGVAMVASRHVREVVERHGFVEDVTPAAEAEGSLKKAARKRSEG